MSTLPPCASAQFPSRPGFGRKSSSVGDFGTQQASLVNAYVAANKDVLTADSKLATALGLKAEAAGAQATGEALSEGATTGNLSDADKVQSDASKAIAEKLKETPGLDTQAKATYASGLASLASGVLKYVGMKNEFDRFKSGISGASVTQLANVQAGTYIVHTYPTNMASLGSALKNAVSFAKSQDIPVPEDATKALAAF